MPQEAVRDIEWQQYAYAKAGVDEKFESAAEEAAANYVADLLEGGQVLDEFIARQTRAGNRNVLQKIGDAIRNVYRDVKAYLSGDEARAIRQSIKKLEAALDAAAEQAKKNAKNGVTAEAKATQQALYHDATTAAEVEAAGPDYSLVMDQALLDRLNSEDTVTVYRAMQLIDGELYPPMAAKVKSADGKKTLVEPTKIGDWYQADEHPELVKNGKFELDKGNGSSINAAYNPYFHTSASPLNDQFSSAYDRPNLVVVEGVIPRSELTSGYRAEGAKDSVGETRWHSGPVASQLKGDKARRVFLSRWFQAQRIVPDAEVAGIVAETLRGENISVPENVVTPGLRDALREAGVEVGPAQTRYRDAVAKKNAARGGVKFSLKDIVGEKKDYGQGVLLDTNLFDGIAPRNWGRVLGDSVYKNLAGTQMVMYDEAGNEKTVTFARLNDRVRKDGAKNSHKVIDKLARYTGDNVKALATIHLSEMLRASGNESHTDEHNHQWLDENGWTYRTAYLQTRDGNIYEATLNIANGRDRDILYAISNVKQIDKSVTGGAVPSTGTEGARTTSRNASDRRVPHPGEPVKGAKFSLKQRDDAYAAAVERGDMDEAQRMVDEPAKAAGYKVVTYHGTDAVFTVFKEYGGNEYGYHVGTEKAARSRVEGRDGAQTLRLYTKLGRTIQTPDVFGVWRGLHDYISYVLDDEIPPDDLEFLLKDKKANAKYKNAAVFKKNNEYYAMRDAVENAVAEGYKRSAIWEAVRTQRDYLLSLGVDAVAYKNQYEDTGSKSYMLLHSNQVKSADPVTYDDNGNVIPLSERFNQKRDDIRYSIKRDFSNVTPATRQESMDLDATDDRNVARYQNEVTQVLDGTMRSNQLVLLGRPSDILKKYLGSDKALYMPQSAVKKAALPKESGGKHGLGRVVVDELPYQFADPMAITGNTTEHVEKGDNSIVVWTDWKTVAGNSIIVPIRIDAKGKLGIYNNVNTAFDVNTEVYYNDLLREGNVLYTRDNKSIRELLTQRRYVPKWEQANASRDSVPQSDGNVNYSLKGTETQREIVSAIVKDNPELIRVYYVNEKKTPSGIKGAVHKHGRQVPSGVIHSIHEAGSPVKSDLRGVLFSAAVQKILRLRFATLRMTGGMEWQSWPEWQG